MKTYVGLPYLTIALICVSPLLSACGLSAPQATPQTEELIFRNWEGDIPQTILDSFKAEQGITVKYLPYDSQEEAVADIKAGQVYDVVVLENQLIQALIADKLLAEIDYRNVPNFKNISPNFRDLAYDPKNAHSIPYSWGATGLVVRTDLLEKPVTRWADLWDKRYAGKLLGWNLSRYMIGIALKSQGHSLNSKSPSEVKAAVDSLIALKPNMTFVDWESAVGAPYLVKGEVVIAVGQSDDTLKGQEQNKAIAYVVPEEGPILWGDNFVIPANSPNKEAAEKFINFLLKPEISAQIVNASYYWLPNDAALPLVNPEIRDNPAIFPPPQMLKNAEILMALSPEVEALYEQEWERFLASGK